jgi:cytidine deaminase
VEESHRGIPINIQRANLILKAEVANIEQAQLRDLALKAWKSREHAYVLGNTKVGAAVLANDGAIFLGCNVEHKFRSHDVHAEVSAVTSMVASGRTRLIAMAVVAERENFTPCGSCLDWIFQFGGSSCVVVCQSRPDGELRVFRAGDLMPHYPS